MKLRKLLRGIRASGNLSLCTRGWWDWEEEEAVTPLALSKAGILEMGWALGPQTPHWLLLFPAVSGKQGEKWSCPEHYQSQGEAIFVLENALIQHGLCPNMEKLGDVQR